MILNTRLNEKQQQFLHSKNKNVLVSASAGSGKTTTMIEKLVSLIIDDGYLINQMLVATFTDASANEMKQKLYKSLVKYSKTISQQIKDCADLTQKQNLTNKLEIILHNIEELNYSDIGTFHSIFKKLITKYFFELSIDPSFKLITAEEQSIMLSNSITRVLRKYSKLDDELFYTLQETFNQKRNDNVFREVVTGLFYLSKEKVDYNEWFNNLLQNNYSRDIKNHKTSIFLYEHFKNSLLNYEYIIKKIISEYNDYDLQNFANQFTQLLSFIESIKTTNNIIELNKIIFEFAIIGSFPRSNKYVDDEKLYEFIQKTKDVYNNFKDTINNAKINLVSDDIDSLVLSTEKTSLLLKKLKEVVDKVDVEYAKQKSRRSNMDFNDLQTKMLELIQNQKVVKELQNMYTHIFIDEFQDVNEIQYIIAKAISKENNLHMIGDVKQSIYEFRLASPQIFIDTYDEFLIDTNANEIIDLNKNYRSSKNILEFVNTIFNSLITKETIGIDYKNRSQLEAGNQDLIDFDNQLKRDNILNVQVNIVPTVKDVSDVETVSEETNEQGITDTELEAEIIAVQVRELLGKPYFNTDKKQVEHITFKDIAILTRDNSKLAKQIFETLNKYKIPCTTTTKQSLFETNEVMVLYSLLKVISNEIDDYSISTVLISPIFNFTFNELAIIRQYLNDKKISYYLAIQNFLQLDDLPKEHENIKSKLLMFFETIEEFRFTFLHSTVYDSLKKIINKYDLYNYYYSLPNGKKVVGNIEEFLNIINTPSFDYNLPFCIAQLDIIKQNDSIKINYSGGENAVKIITMHKSKGLEYPAVIIAGLGNSFNNSSSRQELSLSNNLGMAIRNKDIISRLQTPTLQYNACRLEKKISEQKEQIRLLYVAMTRAKNYLILTGKYRLENIKNLIFKNVLHCSSFLEMILKSNEKIQNKISEKLLDDEVYFSEIINEKVSSGFDCQFKLSTSVSLDINLSDIEKVGDFTDISYDKTLLEKLKNNISFEYEKTPSFAIKNSVSSLLQEQDYVSHNPEPKELLVKENVGQTVASELGTAYHEIMSKIDLFESDKNVESQINNIIEKMGVKNEITKLIEIKKIIDAKNIITKHFPHDNYNIVKEKQFIMQDKYCNLVEGQMSNDMVIIQGVVDLILINKNNNTATIIDYKTNANTTSQKLIDTYKLQLDLYAKAVEYGFNVNSVEKYIYSFWLNDLIKV